MLRIQHRQFLTKRDLAAKDQGAAELSIDEFEEEKGRRKKMAALQRDLYGTITGSLANDPEWDDVIPIPQNQIEGELAEIAYPDDYAEGMSAITLG